jgi:hypothetical protein
MEKYSPHVGERQVMKLGSAAMRYLTRLASYLALLVFIM